MVSFFSASEITRQYRFRVTVGIALLFVVSQLVPAPVNAQTNRPWTAAGSTGTIDEDSAASASVLNFVLGFNAGTTGTITARYNITPTHDLSRFCPATLSHVAIRYRDDDGPGAASQVIMTIHRSNILSGGNNTLYTFDSNAVAAALGPVFQTYATDAPIDFDFATGIYWVEVQVIRGNANNFVNFASVQISESAGTACP